MQIASKGMIKQIVYEVVTVGVIFEVGVFGSSFIPVPGSLISMGLFFILLRTKWLDAQKYQCVSTLILKNLAFFFIPPAVQIINSMDELTGSIAKLVVILVISNVLVMGVTGLVVQLFMNRTGEAS